MLSTLRRGLIAAVACLALVASLGASAANATLSYYFANAKGNIGPGLPWVTGSPHSITSNYGFVEGTVCVGAIDVYGGTLSGVGACGTWGYPTTVTHPYCGCVLRDGAIYPNGSGSGAVYTAYETY